MDATKVMGARDFAVDSRKMHLPKECEPIWFGHSFSVEYFANLLLREILSLSHGNAADHRVRVAVHVHALPRLEGMEPTVLMRSHRRTASIPRARRPCGTGPVATGHDG